MASAPSKDPADIKAAIAALLTERCGDEIEAVLTEEPAAFGTFPALTMMTSGFGRAGLATPVIEGESDRIKDPIGGRTWLWGFMLRLWVPLKADAGYAQQVADKLSKAVVLAIEFDKTLGGIADDSAVVSGRFAKVSATGASGSQAALMCEMETFVEVTEEARQ